MSQGFNDSQERVLRAATNLCVVAGAGSGKTKTLVERIVRFLENNPGDYGLDRVLALTFTAKAATEMRSRLLLSLRERLSAAEGAEAELFWSRQIRLLSQAEIGTIHSYANNILRRRSFAIGLPLNLEILAAGDAGGAIEDALLDLLGEEDPSLIGALRDIRFSAAGRKESLLAWLGAMAARISAWGLAGLSPARGYASGKPIAEMGGEFRDELAEFLSFAENSPARKGSALVAEGARPLLEFVGPWAETLASGDSSSEDREEFIRGMDRFFLRAGAFLDSISSIRDPAKGPAHKQRLKELLGEIRDWESLKRSAPLKENLASLSVSLQCGLLAGRLAAGSVNFDDILSLARRILLERLETRDQERERWKLILVDEFQDTNRLQADIIALILQDPPGEAPFASLAWETVPPRLGVFGDPKQSIYRFRGSEPSIMTSLGRDLPAGGGALLALDTNYRTQKNLISFFNAFFPSFLDEDYHAQQSARPSLYPGPAVAYLQLPDAAEKFRADEWKPREAAQLVRYLGDLFSGAAGVLLPDRESAEKGATRVPNYGDVALLFRKKSRVDHYERALRQAGFPFQNLKGRDLLSDSANRGLMAAYLFLAGLAPDFHLAATLLSPLGPVREETLDALAFPKARSKSAPVEKKGSPLAPPSAPSLAEKRALSWYFDENRQAFPDRLSGDDRETLEELRELLLALRPQVFRLSPGAIMESIVEERGLIPLVFQAAKGSAERVRDIQSFLEIVKNLPLGDLESPLSAADHIYELFQGERFTGEDEAEALEEENESAANAIRIMTIHKSKGLEFPVAIVPEADSGFRAMVGGGLAMNDAGELAVSYTPEGRSVKLEGPDYRDIKLKEREFDLAEHKRLFYVAATRAEDHLVLLGQHRERSTTESWLNRVLSWEGAERHIARVGCPAESAGEDEIEDWKYAPKKAPLKDKGVKASDKDPGAVGLRHGDIPKLPLITPLKPSGKITASVTQYAQLIHDQRRLRGEKRKRATPTAPAWLDVWDEETARDYDEPEALERDFKARWVQPELPGGALPLGGVDALSRGILFHAVMEKTSFFLSEEEYRELFRLTAAQLAMKPSLE
ncbi:MAG: UvrD-helicase domain-containing protein, partial [Deltaproteobacteria bacterium]|nr:UvrD-helicase domain-containing protein [Deltaproteobacteria bacterium]